MRLVSGKHIVAKQPRPPRRDFITNKLQVNGAISEERGSNVFDARSLARLMDLAKPLGFLTPECFRRNRVNFLKHRADTDEMVIEDLSGDIKQLK